jgi:hypothetical protein
MSNCTNSYHKLEEALSRKLTGVSLWNNRFSTETREWGDRISPETSIRTSWAPKSALGAVECSRNALHRRRLTDILIYWYFFLIGNQAKWEMSGNMAFISGLVREPREVGAKGEACFRGFGRRCSLGMRRRDKRSPLAR